MKNRQTDAVVLTQFEGGGIMPYFVKLELKVGDFVVVETNRGKLKVVQVIQTENVDPKFIRKATKQILQPIDMDNYRLKKTY